MKPAGVPTKILEALMRRLMQVKVNSVEEACANYFAVHKSKIEILQTTWKNKTKHIKMLDLLMKNWKLRLWCSVSFFHVIWIQIVTCELQSIWHKILELSWLWFVPNTIVFGQGSGFNSYNCFIIIVGFGPRSEPASSSSVSAVLQRYWNHWMAFS